MAAAAMVWLSQAPALERQKSRDGWAVEIGTDSYCEAWHQLRSTRLFYILFLLTRGEFLHIATFADCLQENLVDLARQHAEKIVEYRGPRYPT